MLSSGGRTDKSLHRLGGRHPGSTGQESHLNHLAPGEPPRSISFSSYLVRASRQTSPTGCDSNGTTVTRPSIPRPDGDLEQTVGRSSKNCAFEFTRPVDDYASDAMIKLWYSWAQYYLAHWKDKTPSAPTGPTPITGSIEKNPATLTSTKRTPSWSREWR